METPFLIRSVRTEDLEQLFALSELVYFLNLPSDRDILKQKIATSIASFSGEIENKFERKYILVMENLEDNMIIGSSMILARHGTPESPHMYFELKEVRKYSETIHTGFIHKLLRLRFDTDGPTEIGGLVLHPNYRNHPWKLGRQLSFSRFMFIKMKRRWFKNHIISELMPPLTENGESIVWEAIGRKFTNLSYQEADILSRKNKEFVTSLFPKGDIYTCLLPGEARDAIGKVGKETEPVKYMLEKIGFHWREHIDPFDGGPHYIADTDKVSVVKATVKKRLSRDPLKKKSSTLGLFSVFDGKEFRAAPAPYELSKNRVIVPKTLPETLGVSSGSNIFFHP